MKDANKRLVVATCLTSGVSNKSKVAMLDAEDCSAGGGEGSKCAMGEDDCGYETDQKLICGEADMTGAKMTDEQTKAMKDAGASDDDVTKAEEAMQALGKVSVCVKSADCDSSSAKWKEAEDQGISLSCSAKALAGAMAAAFTVAATM